MAQYQDIHQDQKYIDGLVENDDLLISEIYKRFSAKMKNWIIKNSGSVADAGDIFQEAIITIYHQALEKDLTLTCPFEAYLFVIIKRMWFKELKKRGRKGVTIDVDEVYHIGTNNIKELEEALVQQEKESKVMHLFETLGESCRKIIRMCLKKDRSQEEIAKELAISYGYLRKKKSECMAKLVEKVQASNLKI